MNLFQYSYNILDQLSFVIKNLDTADFSKPTEVLSKSSIGQHVRHVIEFFECFLKGYESGIVNYDKRDHDKILENNQDLALRKLGGIKKILRSADGCKNLFLELSYDNSDASDRTLINTNFQRELAYNIEHAVHHMAIIKIGLRELRPEMILPYDFGIAASTLKYEQEHVYSDLFTHRE
jgi:uncharacterized damage-inducible protein DinB